MTKFLFIYFLGGGHSLVALSFYSTIEISKFLERDYGGARPPTQAPLTDRLRNAITKSKKLEIFQYQI